jgi:hypothetical protein
MKIESTNADVAKLGTQDDDTEFEVRGLDAT